MDGCFLTFAIKDDRKNSPHRLPVSPDALDAAGT